MNKIQEYFEKENKRIKQELAKLNDELAQEVISYVKLKNNMKTELQQLELQKRHNYRIKDINTKINKKISSLIINNKKIEKHANQEAL